METETRSDSFTRINKLEKSLYDLSDIYRKHQQYIKVKYKISALEMEIIQLIVLQGPKKMKDIGEHFQIKLSTLTSIVDKIENQKLVKRVNSKEDRRVVFLEVARKGARIYDNYSRYIHRISQAMKNNMNDELFFAFVQGIKTMSEAVEEVEEINEQ